jgi:hypothetical protein
VVPCRRCEIEASQFSSTQAGHEGCPCHPKPLGSRTPYPATALSVSRGATVPNAIEQLSTFDVSRSCQSWPAIRTDHPTRSTTRPTTAAPDTKSIATAPPRHDRSVGRRGRRTRGPSGPRVSPQVQTRPFANAIKPPRTIICDHFMIGNDQPRPTLDGQESFTAKGFLDTPTPSITVRLIRRRWVRVPRDPPFVTWHFAFMSARQDRLWPQMGPKWGRPVGDPPRGTSRATGSAALRATSGSRLA